MRFRALLALGLLLGALAGHAWARTSTVKDGDTLWRVAVRELGDGRRWPEIASLNRLSEKTRLTAGQTLVLPDKTPARTPQPEPEPANGEAPPATGPEPEPAAAIAAPLPFAAEPVGVPVTLDALVRIALERNLHLMSARIQPKLAAQGVQAARAAFDPQLEIRYDQAESEYHPLVIEYPLDVEIQRVEGSISGQLPFSTRYKIATENIRTVASSREASALANLWGRREFVDHGVMFSLEQPLMKGVGRNAVRSIEINLLGSAVAALQFERVAEQTIARLEKAYWLLSEAEDAERMQRDAVARAKYQVERSTAMVDRGASPRLDLVMARQNLALHEADLLRATRRRLDTLEQLLLMVYGDKATDRARSEGSLLRTVRAEPVVPPLPSEESAMAMALAARGDYRAAQKSIEQSRTAEALTRNAMLPEVNLQGGVGAGRLAHNFSLALSNPPPMDKHPWEVGVVVKMPLGNNAARADHEKALLDIEARRIALSELGENIKIEVRQALRAVHTEEARLTRAEEARREAAEAYRTAWAARQAGQIDPLQLQQYEETYEKADIAVFAARRDLATAITNYHLAVGGLWEQYYRDIKP